MKNNNFRLIVWIILLVVFTGLGVLGLFENMKNSALTIEEKTTLDNISTVYNNTDYVRLLKERNIITNSEIKGNKIVVKYSDQVEDTKFYYEFKDNELKIKLDNTDENAWLTAKILVDSISILNGNPEKSTYELFDSIKMSKQSDDPSLTINTNNNKIEIIFSTINPLTVIKSNLENALIENEDLIKAFDYVYEDKNLNLILSKTESYQVIEIKQKMQFDDETYRLLINILSLIYNEDEINEFKMNYPELSNEPNIEFENFTITKEKIKEYNTLKISIKIP